ncbi:MAG: hypothetical protein EBZ24_13645, partial [Synechococcaceae bacterium WB9_4xB_025]|nr:hypothetical protein [Synechococcaceae bacterium WB9_4xB_025]
ITDLFGPAELKKSGREFVTRCPWHDDRHPSLSVSPTRNRVHCFVCGKGTDAIGWLQDQQGMSFQEAVLELARRTGVSVADGDPEAQERFEQEWRERRALMAQRTEQRAQFHQALFQQLKQGGLAAEYLQTRGITADTARTWQLGFTGGRLVIPLNDASGQLASAAGPPVAKNPSTGTARMTCCSNAMAWSLGWIRRPRPSVRRAQRCWWKDRWI